MSNVIFGLIALSAIAAACYVVRRWFRLYDRRTRRFLDALREMREGRR